MKTLNGIDLDRMVLTVGEFEPKRARELIPGNQLALYVMVGGGLIGKLFAEQPADAYRDSRAGRAPYNAREIEAMRRVLCALARRAGLDPHNLPPMQNFHAAGVF